MTSGEREQIFIRLFEDYRDRILRLCRGYLGSCETAEAEDLFQEIMIRVWKSLPGLRGEARPETWLYRIAVNSALTWRRKRNQAAPLFDVPDTRPAPPESLETQERVGALHRAINRLSEQDRLIAGLLLEGLSYADIAAVTGLTTNHIGVKISRIRAALEKSVKEHQHGKT